MIHVEHLKKSFGVVKAADDVSFDVAKGEVVGLLGPNGAGKTTTMRIVTGYLTADAGLATIDGIPVAKDGLETRRLVGYLPENAPTYLDMEVIEYLKYICSLRGVSAGERKARINEMVETCGLGEVVGRTISNLSKGFRQRVGLAAAMIHHPPALVLDEPTTGLDPNQIGEIRTLIKEIGKKRTIILSTHILQEVHATCSRALIINKGRLVASGTIEELSQKGRNASIYTVSVRAKKDKIKEGIDRLGLKIDKWLSGEGEEIQRLSLSSDGHRDCSEDIFKWAVASNFVLSELKKEKASLEEVFKKLTSVE